VYIDRMKKRRSYDREFKIEAVRLETRDDKSLAQVARNLGISTNVLHKCKSKLISYPQFAFPGKGKLNPADLWQPIRRR